MELSSLLSKIEKNENHESSLEDWLRSEARKVEDLRIDTEAEWKKFAAEAFPAPVLMVLTGAERLGTALVPSNEIGRDERIYPTISVGDLHLAVGYPKHSTPTLLFVRGDLTIGFDFNERDKDYALRWNHYPVTFWQHYPFSIVERDDFAKTLEKMELVREFTDMLKEFQEHLPDFYEQICLLSDRHLQKKEELVAAGAHNTKTPTPKVRQFRITVEEV